MPTVDFFRPDSTEFCEGLSPIASHGLFGAHSVTEWANTISCLPIVFFGIWGMVKGRHWAPFPMMMHAILALVGIGSALYHLTLYFGFGLLDTFPMTLLMGFASVTLLNEVAHEKITRGRKFALAAFALIAGAYMLVGLVSAVFSPLVFRNVFSIPFVLVVGITIWFYIDAANLLPGSVQTRDNAKNLIRRIWISTSVSVVCWKIDVLVCPHWVNIVYFFGHVWWHIGIGYAGLCAISLTSYLMANNYGHSATIRYVGKVLPVIEYA